MEQRNKTAHYRRCIPEKTEAFKDTPIEDFNLQKSIALAEKTVKLPWKRPFGTSGKLAHHLTDLIEKNNCICGVFVISQKDKKVALVDAEADGRPWKGTVDPKDDAGKIRELQDQELIFAIRENHIAVIQSPRLTHEDLHGFLNWFIQTKTGGEPAWKFTFQNIPSAEAIAKMHGKKITAITIGKDAFNETKNLVTPVDGSVSKRKRYTKTIETDGFKQILTSLGLSDGAVLDDLHEKPDIGKIWLELEIRYKSRSIKDSQNLMYAIASTLGDKPLLKTCIKLGRQKIEGKLLTISESVKVQFVDGLMSEDDAMTRLSEWLTSSLESGTIPPK